MWYSDAIARQQAGVKSPAHLQEWRRESWNAMGRKESQKGEDDLERGTNKSYQD
jgi:hypothetical protein